MALCVHHVRRHESETDAQTRGDFAVGHSLVSHEQERGAALSQVVRVTFLFTTIQLPFCRVKEYTVSPV